MDAKVKHNNATVLFSDIFSNILLSRYNYLEEIMKKNLIILLTSGILSIMFFTSCDTLPPGFSEFLNVSIDGTNFENTGSYNFGLTEAEGNGKTSTLIQRS